MTSVFEKRAKKFQDNNFINPNETRYFNKFTGQEDTIGTEPYFVPKAEQESVFQKRAKQIEPEEGWGKWALRTAGSIGTGIASAKTWPFDIANLVGAGLAYDPNTIEELRLASERAGIPFNEDEYFQAVQDISQKMPTATNIAGQIESKTGIPLTPKTGFQKFANFAATAGTLAPKGNTFVGMNTSLPRPILGAGVAGVAEAGKSLGVPEPIADIASFGILKTPTAGAGSFSVGSKTKPSGLSERQFESLKKEREVSQGKINQINKKVKNDFKKISDKIIADSEIGATKKALLENPSYKNETTQLFKEAENIASDIKKIISKENYSKEIANIAKQESSGYRKNEYQRDYHKFIQDAQNAIEKENISASKLLEQYRNNNQELTTYYESGRSKSFNNAKRDALLSENRAIANVFEKHYPESNLSTVFKEGNDRWSKIKDLEMVEDFTSELFKEGTNYKKINDFFNKTGYDRSFKKALGENSYKQFEQLMKDMLQGEQGYKMLNVAKEKGFNELAKTGMYYILHPHLAITKGAFDIGKSTLKTLFNTMLDTPKLSFTYRKAVQDLKAGNFKDAESGFKTLNEAVKTSEISKPTQAKLTPKMQEPIEAKVEPIKPNIKKQEALTKFKERKNTSNSQEKNPNIVFDKINENGMKSDVIKKIDKTGKVEAELTYASFPQDKHNTITYIENKGNPQNFITLLEELHKKNPDFIISGANFTEKGAKIFSKLTGHKLTKNSFNPEGVLVLQPNEVKKLIDKFHKSNKNYSKPNINQIEYKPKEPIKPTEPQSYFEKSKSKSNYELSEKDLVNETLKLKTELNNTKGTTSIIKEKKQDLRDAIDLNEGIYKDIVSKRRKLEASLEEKTEASVNKFTTKDLKKQKDYILNAIDEAIAKPTNKEFVEIKVPDDGTFKIYNIEDILKQFQKKVKKNYPLKQSKTKL